MKNVSQDEIDAFAAAIKLNQLPSLETVEVPVRPEGFMWFEGRMAIRRIFKAILSLHNLQVVRLPYHVRDVDLMAFADALELRSRRGLPGLKELYGLKHDYVVVEDSEENGEEEEENFDVIARILKPCLPTLERFRYGQTSWKVHHLRSLGACMAASPPIPLKELSLSISYEASPDSFIPVSNAIKVGAAPLLERFRVRGYSSALTGPSVVSLCDAIEQGAFSKLQELELKSCLFEDDGMAK